MPETFHCPQCGKEYPRENRLVGKAVACECGHRFLVPPRDPASGPLVGIAFAPGARQASAASDASPPSQQATGPLPARAIRPNQPGSQKPARWADPMPPNEAAAQEPTPLTDADLIDDPRQPPPSPASAYVPTPAVTVPYHAQVVGVSSPGSVLPARSQQPPPGKHRPASKPTTQDGGATIGLWVSRIVLFVFLPTAVVCSVMAVYLYSRHGRSGAPAAVSPPSISAASRPGGAAPSAATGGGAKGEPFPAGKLVTIWDGKNVNRGGQLEFSLEYRLDGLSASPDTKYFWVIVDRAESKVEFPIPAGVLKPRDRLSGQPKGVSESQFQAPYKMHLERHSPGMSQRETISNVIQISGN